MFRPRTFSRLTCRPNGYIVLSVTTGRPREFEWSDVVDRAMACFWRSGFQGTSTESLMRCTGLSKSSLYGAFGSKLELFEICLIAYRTRVAGEMRARLQRSPSALSFIRRTLEAPAREAGADGGPRGCLVWNTASEFSQRDPGVAARIDDSVRAFRDVFRDAVRRAQAEGDIAKDKDADTLAQFLIVNMSGLRVLAKAGASAASIRRAARLAVDALIV